MFVYDQLDILTFVQTTGTLTVDVLDCEIDDLTTTGQDTNILDLEVAVPNHIGQSVYVVPRADAKGGVIGGTGDPRINATLYSGAAANAVTRVHAAETQATISDVLEFPLPDGVQKFIKVKVKSNGGGASNAINAGGVQVFIGKSGKRP